ncbi:DUF3040 domain-containing protein [Streptomyces narbonensis]|uniref:DUF3040 domain-containing protein n=1 Tax=Streptomyces narbonensis TaxID=67333 RepID=UPI00167AB50D|nr:DUF3040 domain-containing protein [Streptomyces narbonensis]GGV94405.1 hypothetical protein GCM10010230_07480 [Streptomyces narbonensis]
MTGSDDERIADLEAALWHDDPRFARGLGQGRPCRPREYRRGRAWPVTALGALAAVVAGALIPNGLVLAAGLIAAAFAVHLFDATRRRRGRHPGPGRGEHR